MRKISQYLLVGALGSACLLASGVANARAQVSPFQDNLTVQLNGFPGAVKASYANDNAVNIAGPTALQNGNNPVIIKSSNEIENGFPSMTITQADGSVCVLGFVDGPLSYLAYKAGQAPSCSHIQVGTINNVDQYQYQLALTYKS